MGGTAKAVDGFWHGPSGCSDCGGRVDDTGRNGVTASGGRLLPSPLRFSISHGV
jgi:hypothetical protein